MELIEAKALANIRPEFNKDGNPADIVRKGGTAWLTVEELEKYVDLGAVERPKFKYAAPPVIEEEKESSTLSLPNKQTEGGDA